MTLYMYGMRLRGFAPMCQPKKGFYERIDDTGKFNRKYWDILLYTEKLPEKEVFNYDLDYLGEMEK